MEADEGDERLGRAALEIVCHKDALPRHDVHEALRGELAETGVHRGEAHVHHSAQLARARQTVPDLPLAGEDLAFDRAHKLLAHGGGACFFGHGSVLLIVF